MRPKSSYKSKREYMVSIHAPVLGATNRGNQVSGGSNVSIHAPVLGATDINSKINNSIVFQSTHPYWVRHDVIDDKIDNFKFQSTHPYWVRLTLGVGGFWCRVVSIHAPVLGATHPVNHPACAIQVSIHAPVLGATGYKQQNQ